MPSMRKRKIAYLQRNGFLPSEARQLSRTSHQGLLSPYFQYWIRSRRRLYDNSKMYDWTSQEYRDYIKQQYIDIGALKSDNLGRIRIDVWAMLRYFEEKSYRRGEEYESPWKKRAKRKSVKRQESKRVTRKDMIISMIANIDRSIARTKNPEKRADLMARRNYFQLLLDKLG